MSSGPNGIRGQLARVRASLKNPQLVGETGVRSRYLKIQWCTILWRLMVLLQIPVLILACPDRFLSIPLAFGVFSITLVYTLFYAWMATRTEIGTTLKFHVIDVLACAAFMFLAHEDELVAAMAYYSFASLLSYPTYRFVNALPATLFLGLAYLGATAMVPEHLFDVSRDVEGFVIYFFWGMGFVAFSRIMARVSSLELDAHLDEQRQNYRRHLHDDLGNTLCGLHFRIQSLARVHHHDELSQAFDFLVRGYERASAVLANLLNGIDAAETDDLEEALVNLHQELENDGNTQVRLDSGASGTRLSPEVIREVSSIVREAAMNAFKHARASDISISSRYRRGKLRLTVTDDGPGFSEKLLDERQSQGSMGLQGMRERAQLINGRLSLDTGASGTTVALEIDAGQSSRVKRRHVSRKSERREGGLYPFLVRLKVLVLLLALIQVSMMPAEGQTNVPLIFVVASLVTETLLWWAFRHRLFALLLRRPWLLLIEQAYFCLLFYVCWHYGQPLVFSESVSLSVILSAYFLGVARNLGLALLLGAGTVLAGLLNLAQAASSSVLIEEMVVNVTSNLIFAVTAGLAVEFVRSLEGLQQSAVSRALVRQRERLTHETHRQLHSLVDALRSELLVLGGQLFTSQLLLNLNLHNLESHSTELKTKLRAILRSLDEPAKEETEAESAA